MSRACASFISSTKPKGKAVLLLPDTKTGDQTFLQVTSGTLCLDTATGQSTTTTTGIYRGGTGKFTGATGTFTLQASGSYLMFGFKNGIFGGFGQFSGTSEATVNLPNGKGN